MNTVTKLRKYAVMLDVSGSVRVLENTKLYRDSFRFVALQCYVPVTPLAVGKPLCTVHRSVCDAAGVRQTFNKEKHNMLYVSTLAVEGADYMLFECPVPEPFTRTAGDLELVFEYAELNDQGEAIARLTSSIFKTQVEDGGGEGELVLDLASQEAGQINSNTFAIEQLTDDVQKLLQPPDCTDADYVGTPTVSITEDGNFKFSGLKGEQGVSIANVTATLKETTEDGSKRYDLNVTLSDGRVLKTDFTAPRGAQGVRGEPGFGVKKVYASEAELLAGFDTDGLLEGEFAVIETGDANNPENSRLYVKGTEAYLFVTDLSGSQGIEGPQGKEGADGTSVSVESTSITYQASTSGTTVPAGTWSNTVPAITKGQYLWSKTVVSYSDGKSTTTYNVGYQGTNGTNGTNGVSAGFGTPKATVDANIGTPSVTIAATGDDTAKVFNFTFKNLKGEKGEAGENGKTPTFTINDSGELIANFE